MRRFSKWLGIALGVLALLFGAFVLLAKSGKIGPPPVSADAIEHAVERRPDLLARAFALPAAKTYGHDTYFQTHGSYCGPASLVNVLQSLGVDAKDEADVLDGTGKCGLGFCWMGLNLDELADVVRARGRQVEVLRDLTPEAFREHLRKSNDPSVRYIVNFTRQAIFGAGGGHHSPVAGYLEPEDLVLVLDVNQNFRPWLIQRQRLYAAVDTLDGAKKRGLLLIR